MEHSKVPMRVKLQTWRYCRDICSRPTAHVVSASAAMLLGLLCVPLVSPTTCTLRNSYSGYVRAMLQCSARQQHLTAAAACGERAVASEARRRPVLLLLF